MSSPSFSIKPATYEDVPALAKIWNDSFEVDRHTQMKNQGKVPYDMEKLGKSQIPKWLSSRTCVILKAVDDETGESIGWVAWGFRGLENEMPIAVSPEEDEACGKKEEESEPETEQSDDREESIKKLGELTDQDRKNWTEKLMPLGTKCMFVTTLSIAPAYQKRGVGSALLEWGIDVADKNDAFIWVHSSEGAWGMYAKSGFEIVGTLDVDLDEYAVRAPDDGTEKWGHYVFRYMKYLPKKR